MHIEIRLLHQKNSLSRKFARLALLIQTMWQFCTMKEINQCALVLSQFGKTISEKQQQEKCLLFSHEILSVKYVMPGSVRDGMLNGRTTPFSLCYFNDVLLYVTLSQYYCSTVTMYYPVVQYNCTTILLYCTLLYVLLY